MRKLTALEIKTAAKRIADSWLTGYSLKNAKKISLEVRRLLVAEDQRRKKIETKMNKIKKTG